MLPTTATVNADLSASRVQSLVDRARSADTMDRQEVAQVANEFEAAFVSLMLKQLRATTGEGLFPGDSSDIYGSLFDQHMGRALADAGFIDLAEHFLQLTKETTLDDGIVTPLDESRH